MILAMAAWKRQNRNRPVPLAMFAIVATALLWLWTTAGVTCEVLFQLIPGALGWTNLVDVGLSRTLFSWTLHAIVYFWLLPAYIAFYTMAPRAAGGRLYSDAMGRIAFILFLLYSLPVGIHHLFMDPEHGPGFKFLQMVLTSLVTIPTLMTVFTISASMEIAGRLRGGRGLLGWLGALPWDRPMVLATGLAFVMLWLGGLGGLVNMSYGMNAMIHNTSWVTAHFHLIYGGTTVIMYFAIVYEIWPSLTGRAVRSTGLMNTQLWLWFIGMMVTTVPWHWLGLQGQWRRVAEFDYSDPVVAGWGPYVIVSFIGGLVLVASALMFVWNMVQLQRGEERVAAAPVEYAMAVNPPRRIPSVLNGFATWNVVVLVLMVIAYGYPIAQFFVEPAPQPIVQRAR
jgi:cytochrome c oxidase subunit 1